MTFHDRAPSYPRFCVIAILTALVEKSVSYEKFSRALYLLLQSMNPWDVRLLQNCHSLDIKLDLIRTKVRNY